MLNSKSHYLKTHCTGTCPFFHPLGGLSPLKGSSPAEESDVKVVASQDNLLSDCVDIAKMEAVEIEHEHNFPQDSSRVVSGSEAFTRMETVGIKLDV